MPEKTGTGTCPECGTTGAQPGQLLCRGCFVPFSLMTPDRGEKDPDPRAVPPQVGPGAEDTRILPALPGAVPGSAPTRKDEPVRVLLLWFPDGEIVPVEAGARVLLGRDPRLCPEVGFLAQHDNLSRRHATVGVESDGSGWITDEGSTNGTFVRGYRVTPWTREPLRPGDTVRLAADVIVRVLV